ncbi:MAG TPA: GGDEF domain-containing protein [Gammaproteobacteria bacterium]|nr:GGDEF domain-containing protein [Gammaproteobacteria bacterium]
MQTKMPISITPRALQLLQSLKGSDTGAAIFDHVENILEDYECNTQQSQQAYLELIHVLLDEFGKQLKADSPLLIHLKLIKMRLSSPLSASEIRAICKQIQSISQKLAEEIHLPEPQLETVMPARTETPPPAPQVPEEKISPPTPAAAPEEAAHADRMIEEKDEVEEEPQPSLVESSTDEAAPGHEPGTSAAYDKAFADKRNRIRKIQQNLTQHVNEVIKQNEKFGVLLEVEHETLRHTDNIEDIGQLKEALIKEIARLTEGHKALARKLNSASKYLQIIESEGRHLNEELARVHILSLTDELTELPNRRAFMRRLEDEVGRVQRYGYPLSLVLLDLDHFKSINDIHGHAAGDAVLRNFSNNILTIFRHHDLVARYGGEEFAVILPNTDQNGALRALQKVQKKASVTPYHYNGKTTPMPTFSAGVALYHPGEPPSSLIERADKALYQAKRQGRNRIVLADGGEVDNTSPPASAPTTSKQ